MSDATTAMIFSTLSLERTEDACAFVAGLPEMCRGELVDVDLGIRPRARLLMAFARTRGASEEAGRRLAYWCGVLGGRARRLAGADEQARGAWQRALEQCERRLERVPPSRLAEAVASLAAGQGWRVRARPIEAMPTLDLDRAETCDGVRYDAPTGTLFLPAALAPPLGDALPVRIRGSGRGGIVTVRVIAHLAPGQEGQGLPGGFRARIVAGPAEPIGLLAAWEASTAGKRRAAPRFAYRAPAVGTVAEGQAPAPLGADLELTNLSQSGARIRTGAAPAPGTRLRLEFALPAGERIAVDACVVWRDDEAMGVRFECAPEQEAIIGRSLALLSGRRRRALIIDDDALSREIVGDALAQHGYEVLKAPDGAEGLRVLTDELLSLDVVVTDVWMPNMDGAAFVRAVRDAGGEQDLAIVVATGRDDPFVWSLLEAEGVDAIVAKQKGAAGIASAVDSAVRARSSAHAEAR